MSTTQYRLRTENGVRVSEKMEEILSCWHGTDERWLFVAPHDDDIVLGGGLLLQLARDKGVKLCMLITSDGSMGYCSDDQRGTIHITRERETRASFEALGIHDVRWLNFPDCSLQQQGGRRKAKDGDPAVVEGHTGLQNAYTHAIRDFRPTRVFVPGGSDYHPDHKAVYQELLISIFHAGGGVWPELGRALEVLPHVYEMAIYCDFAGKPNLMVQATPEILQAKMDAIRAYRSQAQIERLVENVQQSGPVEFFRELEFELYKPTTYIGDFA